ncbi:Lrp/AsnC family transcriptional regulator [Salinicoccus roseus]|uniref:Transcriptional regulator n=1 Tax=Salinicoccus roseus TaxID=45670 RepID=A0A0C2HAW8_9STAP|nr:Lrp/AsnC family transcriptional regulator [Salinicoccus roseus]KIH70860.1 transcriptional regulator [Salinicoccus roseus]MBY8909292.1 Lrp/AsnC family transcriptional regulator [Salinicoccus roseus]MDB0580516.1 Lrp/AsnC family transcriptional regulator [Salinicoccus roseus]
MLDDTDSLILDALRTNSRITMKELGEKVHLSGPAASARVEKLEDAGVIEGFTIKVNPEKMGYPVHAFITIFTSSSYHTPYLNLVAANEQYVVRNHKISGDGCYLLECRFPSNRVLDEFLVQLESHVNYKLSIAIN